MIWDLMALLGPEPYNGGWTWLPSPHGGGDMRQESGHGGRERVVIGIMLLIAGLYLYKSVARVNI